MNPSGTDVQEKPRHALDISDELPVPTADPGSGSGRHWLRWPGAEVASVVALLCASAVLNLWALTSVGWGNAYYSAAARSMGSSWKSFFFASLDSGNFVSIDKPPFSLWVQVLSSKIFGYSQFSLLLPEALAGIGGVLLLYVGIRRAWGHAAGLAAGAALSVTPIFVAVNHTNVMDSVLVFLMTAAAVVSLEAARRGQLRWLVLACVVAGCAVTAKMAAALPVLPGVLVTYVWCAPRSWRTRLWHSTVAAVVLAAASLWWFSAVWLTPADARPYVGSTQKNSVFELAVERNGVNQVEGGSGPGGGFGGRPGGDGGRRGGTAQNGTPGGLPNVGGGGGAITPNPLPGFPPVPVTPPNDGQGSAGGLFPPGVAVPNIVNGVPVFPGGGAPGGGAPGGFAGRDGRGLPGRGGPGGFGIGFSGGSAGSLRLMNSDLGTQIGWLLPSALLGSFAALIVIGLRGSRKLGALVMFGSWFAGAGIVFSITKGIVHPYYVAQLAPPSAALFGIGFGAWTKTSVDGRRRWVQLLFPIGLVATAYAQWVILRRVEWRGWLAYAAAVAVGTAAVGSALMFVAGRRGSRRTGTVVDGEADRTDTEKNVSRVARFLQRPGFTALGRTLGVGSVLLAPLLWTQGSLAAGISGNLPYANPVAVSDGGRVSGGIAPNGGTTFTTAATGPLVTYLRSQRKGEDWILAVPSAGSAEPIIINTGEPVMALGGFIGSDPIVTDGQLAELVADGRIRFFLASENGGGFAGGGGPFGGGSHASWILSNCSRVDEALWASGNVSTNPNNSSAGTGGRAFPGGPTAGAYSLYDCKPA